MSCPDWSRLASGDDFLRPGAAPRRAALEHAASCPQCRQEALRLDPSLALAAAAAGPPPVEVTRAEIDSVRNSVLAMRRLRQVERESRPRRARLVAVACLTVAILLFARETDDRSPGHRADAGDAADAGVSERPAVLLSEDYRLYGSLPLVESLQPAQARVYQIGREDFSLVWIVDESIELTANP